MSVMSLLLRCRRLIRHEATIEGRRGQIDYLAGYAVRYRAGIQLGIIRSMAEQARATTTGAMGLVAGALTAILAVGHRRRLGLRALDAYPPVLAVEARRLG
jgi:hypothetical protein